MDDPRSRAFWLNELLEMGIKWYKVLDDCGGSSLPLCKELLAHDIMPIVRLYKGHMYPNRCVVGRAEDAVKRLVDIGVRYFEVGNEPDLPVEWKGGRIPPNWLDIVVDNFIADADTVLHLGGLPAVPAMGVGSQDNPIAMIVQRGRADLFERGAWLAIHNYTLNHPLDYPYDDVNQKGTPLTEEEYKRLGPWAWDNQPLELINEWRAKDKNPGATLHDDPACWLAYKLANDMVVEALGYSIPIMSTEGGPVIGWRDDRRYPRVTPEIHCELVLAINDFMQREAPEWYFCVCHWLIANYRMGNFSPGWENQAWYTDWWGVDFKVFDHLPTVDAVKAMPSLARWAPEIKGRLSGVVSDETGRVFTGIVVELWQAGHLISTTKTDASGCYRFEAAAGEYELALPDYDIHRRIMVSAGQENTLNVVLAPQGSTIKGQVTDIHQKPQPGLTVILTSAGREVARTTTDANGRYVIPNLPAGTYQIAVGQAQATVQTDGVKPVIMDLVVPAPLRYRYAVVKKRLLPPQEARGYLLCGRVLNPSGEPLDGIWVQAQWLGADPGTTFPKTRTFADPYKPHGYYEFTVSPGQFLLKVIQGDWESEVADGLNIAGVPGRAGTAYEVDFQLQPVSEARAESCIEGVVPGGQPGLSITLSAQAFSQTQLLDSEGRFAFTNLPAGTYALTLEKVGSIVSDLVLDGTDRVTVEFPMQSSLTGRVVGGAPSQKVILVAETWQREDETTPDRTGVYCFHNLPRGLYRIRVADREITGLELDGWESLTVPDIVFPVQAGKSLAYYLLFGAPGAPGTRSNLLLALPYLQQRKWTFGFSTEAAWQAARVIIVGDVRAVPAEIETQLRDAGCQVGRLDGDSYAVARQLAEYARPS